MDPRTAIRLLVEHAAKAVASYSKTGDPKERAGYYDDVCRHAAALRDLDLSVDDVVDRIVSEAASILTRLEEDLFVVRPERHELDRLVRGLLTPLIDDPCPPSPRRKPHDDPHRQPSER